MENEVLITSISDKLSKWNTEIEKYESWLQSNSISEGDSSYLEIRKEKISKIQGAVNQLLLFGRSIKKFKRLFKELEESYQKHESLLQKLKQNSDPSPSVKELLPLFVFKELLDDWIKKYNKASKKKKSKLQPEFKKLQEYKNNIRVLEAVKDNFKVHPDSVIEFKSIVDHLDKAKSEILNASRNRTKDVELKERIKIITEYEKGLFKLVSKYKLQIKGVSNISEGADAEARYDAKSGTLVLARKKNLSTNDDHTSLKHHELLHLVMAGKGKLVFSKSRAAPQACFMDLQDEIDAYRLSWCIRKNSIPKYSSITTINEINAAYVKSLGIYNNFSENKQYSTESKLSELDENPLLDGVAIFQQELKSKKVTIEGIKQSAWDYYKDKSFLFFAKDKKLFNYHTNADYYGFIILDLD